MSNKKLGNGFENELCETLARNGFWAYNTVNKASGQPADIIAARNGDAYLIDAKVCSHNTFDTVRIEENQKNAMLRFDKCGNSKSYFALKMSDGTVIMSAGLPLIMMRQDKRVFNETDIRNFGTPLDIWMEGEK